MNSNHEERPWLAAVTSHCSYWIFCFLPLLFFSSSICPPPLHLIPTYPPCPGDPFPIPLWASAQVSAFSFPEEGLWPAGPGSRFYNTWTKWLNSACAVPFHSFIPFFLNLCIHFFFIHPKSSFECPRGSSSCLAP